MTRSAYGRTTCVRCDVCVCVTRKAVSRRSAGKILEANGNGDVTS